MWSYCTLPPTQFSKNIGPQPKDLSPWWRILIGEAFRRCFPQNYRKNPWANSFFFYPSFPPPSHTSISISTSSSISLKQKPVWTKNIHIIRRSALHLAVCHIFTQSHAPTLTATNCTRAYYAERAEKQAISSYGWKKRQKKKSPPPPSKHSPLPSSVMMGMLTPVVMDGWRNIPCTGLLSGDDLSIPGGVKPSEKEKEEINIKHGKIRNQK